MNRYRARMRITWDCPVTVEAETKAEARDLLKKGAWDLPITLDDLVDWGDPKDLEEDE